jgi:ketosteroid isomerase-like protein
VRVFGDTAIMTHRGTVVGQESLQYRSTHVWMKRDGRWQLVAHHSSNITPQQPAQPTGQQPPAERKP